MILQNCRIAGLQKGIAGLQKGTAEMNCRKGIADSGNELRLKIGD
jgi:hypothetical protein